MGAGNDMKHRTDNARLDRSTDSRRGFVREKPRAKRPRGLLLLMIAGVVVIGAAAVVKFKSVGSGPAQGGIFAAQRGDLTIAVTEGGSIRARNAIQYTCEVERRGGELSILSIVPAGTYITQEDVDNGKVLVELDASALKERLVRAKLDLATEQEGLTSAKEAYEIQLLQNESDMSVTMSRPGDSCNGSMPSAARVWPTPRDDSVMPMSRWPRRKGPWPITSGSSGSVPSAPRHRAW